MRSETHEPVDLDEWIEATAEAEARAERVAEMMSVAPTTAGGFAIIMNDDALAAAERRGQIFREEQAAIAAGDAVSLPGRGWPFHDPRNKRGK